MSSRLRLIYSQAGVIQGGGNARIFLEHVYLKVVGKLPPRGSMPEAKRLVWMYEKIPLVARGTLYLFREPRCVPVARSRWKQLAGYWSIPPRKQKKALNVRPRTATGATAIAVPPLPRWRIRPPIAPPNRGNRVPATTNAVAPDEIFLDPRGVQPRITWADPMQERPNIIADRIIETEARLRRQQQEIWEQEARRERVEADDRQW